MSADNEPARTGASVQRSPSRMSGSAAFQRAKGLLAAWFGLTPGEAENLLLTWSCENKVSACEVATALVSDIDQGRPSGCSSVVLRYLEARLRDIATVAAPTSARTPKKSDRNRSVEAGTGKSARPMSPAPSIPFAQHRDASIGPLPDPDVDAGLLAPDPSADPDSEPARTRSRLRSEPGLAQPDPPAARSGNGQA